MSKMDTYADSFRSTGLIYSETAAAAEAPVAATKGFDAVAPVEAVEVASRPVSDNSDAPQSTSDDAVETFDELGLKPELLRGIYAYG
jgi:hypothetical protein